MYFLGEGKKDTRAAAFRRKAVFTGKPPGIVYRDKSRTDGQPPGWRHMLPAFFKIRYFGIWASQAGCWMRSQAWAQLFGGKRYGSLVLRGYWPACGLYIKNPAVRKILHGTFDFYAGVFASHSRQKAASGSKGSVASVAVVFDCCRPIASSAVPRLFL